MIYLDHAATTPVCREAAEAMIPYLTQQYGNPSGIYKAAVEGKRAVTEARKEIAAALEVSPQEVFFTSGGTESDNWAIRGAAESLREKGRHIITTAIEHHAVLRTCEYLERHGFEVTRLPVQPDGVLDPGLVEAAIRPDTILISVMAANNEIGTIQPLAKVGEIAAAHRVLFHTDAVQMFGHQVLHPAAIGADLLSASSHKFYGPKGCGFLYVKSGTKLAPLLYGGMQERGRRAGTENVPAIAGMAAAVRKAMAEMEENNAHIKALRDHMISRIGREIPDSYLNGDPDNRLPGNVNFSFAEVEGESVLILLDMAGICASAGSACTSGALDPSHVLRAIGRDEALARSAVRFTIGKDNTMEEIDEAADRLKEVIERLRAMRGSR